MTKALHTPGPWAIEKIEGECYTGFKIIGGPDPLTSICTITGMQEARSDGGWNGGNAKLISAAPDMREALETTARNIRSLRDAGLPGPLEEWAKLVDAVLKRASA